MDLDHSKGCVNFRDVGECVNLISGNAVLPTGRLLRGGKLDFVENADEIGNPGTILNLRMGSDPVHKHFGADYRQVAIANMHEKYHTTKPRVRRWLNSVFLCLLRDVQRLPVLIHCTSGKDRTGVTIAALLTILGIDRDIIIQEYLWSDGKVARSSIVEALDGIGTPSVYFDQIDLEALKQKLLHST